MLKSPEYILAGFGLAALEMILLTLFYVRISRKRRDENGGSAVLNGLGFALLPALATGLVFLQQTPLGRGEALIEPLGDIPWLTENGRFAPSRVECVLCLCCFAGVCLWLMARKQPLPADLWAVCLGLWAGIRLATESLYGSNPTVISGIHTLRFVYCLALLFTLIFWSMRGGAGSGNQRKISWAVFAVAAAVILLTGNRVLTTGSDMADLIVVTGGAALAVTACLTLGAENRAEKA